MADAFFYGLLIGYISYPFWQALRAIVINAWNATNNDCNQNCNQGRSCNCKEKSNGAS